MPHRLISPRTASAQELDALVHVLDGADIIIHRLEGTITHWSIGSENMYGWTREEAVGEPVFELLATRYPASREDILAQLKSRGFWQAITPSTPTACLPCLTSRATLQRTFCTRAAFWFR